MKKIFFGNSGLTSTSANHVANLAKEFVQNVECDLNNVELINSSVVLIGTSDYNVLKEGWNNETLKSVAEKLNYVSQAKSLIAWLREAIKARQALLDEVKNMEMSDWAKLFELELPKYPAKRATITRENVIAGFTIKKRNRMYVLETQASTIGKYIHPDGNFAKARKEYQKRLHNKHDVNGNGRDTLLIKYTPSCDESLLEETYFNLQNLHRECQAELNGILHEIDEAVRMDEVAACAEFTPLFNAFQRDMCELDARFQEYKVNESKRIGDLKIIIPDDLKPIYNLVNSLGKNKA